MKVKAKKVKDGYLIPNIKEFGDLEEIEIEIKFSPGVIDAWERRFSDNFIAEHWRELILTNTDTSEFYKSAEYYIERATDYMERKSR